jgi:universal stress protein A
MARATDDTMLYRRILCPIDFSEYSREATRTAMALASESDAEVTLVHVYQLPVPGSPELPVDPGVIEAFVESTEQALAEYAKESATLGSARVSSMAVQGVPWDQVVTLAREGDFDLVVMGTHGRTGLKHALLGSVAERVVRHAPCPVLVVRRKERTIGGPC